MGRPGRHWEIRYHTGIDKICVCELLLYGRHTGRSMVTGNHVDAEYDMLCHTKSDTGITRMVKW